MTRSMSVMIGVLMRVSLSDSMGTTMPMRLLMPQGVPTRVPVGMMVIVVDTVPPDAHYPVAWAVTAISLWAIVVWRRQVRTLPALGIASVHPALHFTDTVTVIDGFLLLVIIIVVVRGCRQVNFACRVEICARGKAVRR